MNREADDRLLNEEVEEMQQSREEFTRISVVHAPAHLSHTNAALRLPNLQIHQARSFSAIRGHHHWSY